MTQRRRQWSVLALLAVWAAVQFTVGRPDRIAPDWNDWRQTDTQSIALNMLEPGSDLFHPRVNWGGPEGHVETELQLYPWAISLFLRLFGTAEWPGQLLATLAMAFLGATAFVVLRSRFGELPALCATALLLTSRGPVLFSTTIMPDAFCAAFYTLSFGAFLRWLDGNRFVALAISTGSAALAALIKPTALSLGIFQFTLLVTTQPRRLRSWAPWLSWTVILGLVGAYYAHAQQLFLEYGNTFGVGFGHGDSKFPRLRHLLMPGMYRVLAQNCWVWGLGYAGGLAGLYLIVRRRLEPVEWALVISNAAMLIVAMRHTVEWMGSHYHLPIGILGAWFVAHAIAEITARGSRQVVVGALCGALAFGQWGFHLALRHDLDRLNPEYRHVVAMGARLGDYLEPGDLAVVRSGAPSTDDFWSAENNYQDPRIFYLARVRGWVLPDDWSGAGHVRALVERGATFYVEHARRRDDPGLYAWLSRHATVLWDSESDGRIYRLGR